MTRQSRSHEDDRARPDDHPRRDLRGGRHAGRRGPGDASSRHRVGRGDRRRQGRRHPHRARPPAGRGRLGRLRPGAGSALDDGPARRARSRRAGRRRLGQPHLAPLPAPPGGRRRRVRRCGVAPRPDGRGPHPSRRRDERRRPGRARRRRRGRDHGRRRARAGGLLPLPAVLRGGPGRTRDRSRTSGTCCSGASSPERRPRRRSGRRSAADASCRRVCRTLLPALAQRGAPLDVLRTAVSLLGVGARLATDARHRRRRAGGPGPRALRGRPDHPGRGAPARGRGRIRSSRGTTSAPPPTTSTCSRVPSPPTRTRGRSSST